jgi:hypothetical protein
MAAVFLIVSRQTGKALTRSGDAGTPVQQFTQGDNDQTQFWILEPVPADSTDNFKIHPFNDRALAITEQRNSGDDPTPGALLLLDVNKVGEVWRKTRIDNPPYFFLLETGNGLLMDVPNASSDDGLQIQVFTRNENQNQQWTFLPAFELLTLGGP